ncbi:MAG: DMT family transporter [Pseudomonadota bacterium]
MASVESKEEAAASGTAKLWLALTPVFFVVLWSTGFIGAKLGLPDATPLFFLTLRYVAAAALLLAWMLLRREAWPRGWRVYLDLALVGTLLHTFYLGGVFVAIDRGLEAGTSALIVSLQPLLVAALAGVFLGERVRPIQWLGLVLGLAGVALVVFRKAGFGEDGLVPVLFCAGSLLAITLAVLYQKLRLTAVPLVAGSTLQFVFAAISGAIITLIFEPDAHIVWSEDFIIAFVWLVVVLSIGAIGLFLYLVRQGAASRVSSLFFLVPPVTALIAWPLFGEQLGVVELIGMAVAGLGVALVNRA